MARFFRQFNAMGPLFVHYALLPYVLSTSFSTHPKPLTWDKKPFQSRKVPLSTFFDTMRFSPFFGTVRLFKLLIFPRIFFIAPKVPHEFFDILQQNGCSKNPKGSPFCIFRHYATYRRLQKNFEKNSEKFFPQFLVIWELLLSSVVEKLVFESYWALDMAPTWALPGLFDLIPSKYRVSRHSIGNTILGFIQSKCSDFRSAIFQIWTWREGGTI